MITRSEPQWRCVVLSIVASASQVVGLISFLPIRVGASRVEPLPTRWEATGDDLGDRRETGDDQGPQTIETLSLIFTELAIQRPLLTTSAIGMPPIRQTSLAAFGLCSEPPPPTSEISLGT